MILKQLSPGTMGRPPKRRASLTIGQTPGPGAYNHQDGMGPQHTGWRKTNPAYSWSSAKRWARDPLDEGCSPGPAMYNPKLRPRRLRPIHSFSKAVQRPEERVDATPAPNAYTGARKPLGSDRPAFGFGTSQRDATFGMSNLSPGPSAYGAPKALGTGRPKFSFGTAARFGTRYSKGYGDEFPGPTSYSPYGEAARSPRKPAPGASPRDSTASSRVSLGTTKSTSQRSLRGWQEEEAPSPRVVAGRRPSRVTAQDVKRVYS